MKHPVWQTHEPQRKRTRIGPVTSVRAAKPPEMLKPIAGGEAADTSSHRALRGERGRRAALDTGNYPTGAKVTNEQMETIRMQQAKVHGD